MYRFVSKMLSIVLLLFIPQFVQATEDAKIDDNQTKVQLSTEEKIFLKENPQIIAP